MQILATGVNYMLQFILCKMIHGVDIRRCCYRYSFVICIQT